MAEKYRIRWARVEAREGCMVWTERRCIAERLTRVLWIFPFWIPVADWRRDEDQARRDIRREIDLRAPLPPTVIVDEVV